MDLMVDNQAAISDFMRELSVRYPAVFQEIQSHPQEFLNIVNEERVRRQNRQQEGGERQTTSMVISEADRGSIEQLVALGGGAWDSRAATLVYVLCDRNLEAAAAVLFENGGLPPGLAAEIVEGQEGGQEEDDGPE
jgi:hypothetical protein